ncbi:hypothetical protein KYK30_30160 [Shinella yambaruensis]|uniref:Uncharacterized protein n=1 Tax=Shinella yambaruensis TaxID=415996 RepID=A0ABQ5ZDQ8_9HYPH|nr:hypothetical protein [Shinella yambaruensis]MCJ8028735.1 hypothetical protein [Shinella yambaruensis]MCU7983984.1 hypothetical protein [Shinella yambaruensis]GLR49894.1 hypothetical protein GCM10007923_10990 [Shinella yambaruensis]
MATLDQLETALINADAAGDTEAATELAREVGRLRREQAAAQEPAPEGDGMALNATAGLNQSIYNTLGAPVDFSRWLINKGIEGANYVTGSEMDTIPTDSFGGSESISSMFGAVGVPEPKDIQALTPEERIARGVGEGVGYTVTPAGIVGAGARTGALTGRALDTATRMLGSGNSVGRLAGDAIVGGASGAGATAAMEATPDRYDALAGMGGGIMGGGVGALAAGVPAMLQSGFRTARDAAAPLYQAGRERLAARQLADSATDLSTFRRSLEEPAQDLVSGSQPTTFQATGDMGVGGLERGIQTKRPEVFQQRRVDQNSARLSALEGVQRDGSPEKVADAARQIVQAVSERAQAAYDDVVARATAGADEVMAGARRSVDEASAEMGLLNQRMGEGAGARASGDAMRSSLEEARAAAKAAERSLWEAVDPDGSLALPAQNTRQQATTLIAELPRSAKPPSGEEGAIFDVVSQYGDTIPFSELTALQSRIKAEMRAERRSFGETPAYRRLSMLSKATDADIEMAVAGKIQQEAQAVASGQMAEADTLAARWGSLVEQSRNRWLENRGRGAGEGAFESTGTVGAGRQAFISPASGGGSQARSGHNDASSNPGVQETGLLPNFDPGARDRLDAARTATRERVETFDNKTLGPMRRRPAYAAPYDMAAESVPAKVFFGRPESARAIDQYRRAVGQEVADQQLQQYAVSKLRQAASNADGSVNLSKLDTWRRSHAEALDKLPALRQQVDELAHSARGLADRTEAATRIGKAAAKVSNAQIAEAARRQRLMTDAAQRSRLGKVMNADSADAVVKQIGSVFARKDAGAEMLKLNLATRGDPEARAGLRRAVVDHILGKFVGNAEAGTSGQSLIKGEAFQTFVKEKAGALRAAGFSDDEIKTIQNIAADIRRSNRSISALRIPGGSNTAQDIYAAAKSDAASSILSRLLGAYAAGGSIVSVVGGKMASALREAGFQSVDDILADALLNPTRAKLLLQKMPTRTDSGAIDRLAELYRRMPVATAGTTQGEGDRQKKAARLGGGNQTHQWIAQRLSTFGGMGDNEISGVMDALRSDRSGAAGKVMKDLIGLEGMKLSETDKAAAIRYILEGTLGQSPNSPASRWQGQRSGNADKIPLEITVPVRVR